MGKVKLLLDVVGDLRSLADSLTAIAEAMSANDQAEPEVSTTATPPVSAPQEPHNDEPTISLVEVRTKLGELSRAGYTDQVRELIHKYGGDRLGEVDPKRYSDLLKDAEAMSSAAS